MEKLLIIKLLFFWMSINYSRKGNMDIGMVNQQLKQCKAL